MTAFLAIAISTAALAAGTERSRHGLVSKRAQQTDPAARQHIGRRSSRPATDLDTPGQTTALTRETLDDMNATTLRDALRSTAGVTVGR